MRCLDTGVPERKYMFIEYDISRNDTVPLLSMHLSAFMLVGYPWNVHGADCNLDYVNHIALRKENTGNQRHSSYDNQVTYQIILQ